VKARRAFEEKGARDTTYSHIAAKPQPTCQLVKSFSGLGLVRV
jgi:hypothetical protein